MIKVEIQNFQAIDELTVDIQGLTAIVGRSNIGKSSVVRAIKYALAGVRGTDFVRHNPESCTRILRKSASCTCHSKVTFHFQGGQQLCWERGDAINQYVARGADGVEKVYSDVGSMSDVAALFERGFERVDVGPKKTFLQVADQTEPVFLLNLPGTVVADVLSDVAQLDQINAAMKAASKDRRSASSRRNVREEDAKVLEKRLLLYSGLDLTTSKVREVQQQYQTTRQKREAVQRVSGFLEQAIQAGQTLRAMKQALEPSVPDFDAVQQVASSYASVSRFHQKTEAAASNVRTLQGVDELPLPERELLASRRDKLQQVSVFLASYSQSEGLLSTLQGVGDVGVPEAQPLQDARTRAGQAKEWWARLRSLEEAELRFGGIETLSLQPVTSVVDHVSSVRALALFEKRYSKLEAEVTKVTSEVEEAQAEEDSLLLEFEALGACPACSQSIRPGHLAH